MMANKLQYRYTVSVEKPEGVTHAQMVGYIEDAVRTFKGGLFPDDPLFDLNKDSVKVKLQRSR